MMENYHTHTVRCHHAEGTEREYIEQAIARGVRVLGFADHSPYLFDNGYVSPMRMTPEETQGYVDTLRALKREYADRIDIKTGFEMDCFERNFDRTLEWMQQFDLDFLILGQHMVRNEPDDPHAMEYTEDPEILHLYTESVLRGISSGMYSYVAHPDAVNFHGDRDLLLKEMERICRAALEKDLPLEFNLLGFSEKRHYPSESFFRLAHDVGNKVILGCDAHQPRRVADPDEIAQATETLRAIGIEPVKTCKLIKPVR